MAIRQNNEQQTKKTNKYKANYQSLDTYIEDIDLDEKYALITHYIQLDGSIEATKYKDTLQRKSIDLSIFPKKDSFNKEQAVPFPDKKSNSFTFIDLFAGIGGFRLAMQNEGGRCVFSSEWDDAAKQTYFENYGEVPFGDITKEEIKYFIPDHFDVLCAGFPCQAFSIAGYQKGFDDVRGTLFFDVADILEKHRPKAFFLENVKNLKAHDSGRTFTKIMEILENRLNYRVKTAILNPCEHANIPQNRERIFIVGFDPNQVQSWKEFEFPKSKELTKNIHDIIDDSIEDEKFFYKKGHLYFERMEKEIVNPNTVYQWRRVYIRENKSDVCPTLTANMGGGGHNVPIIKTSKGIRKLTPEECLRFQGFPVEKGTKSYRFPENMALSKRYKQAGNSVTEPLIELITNQIMKVIKKG